MFVTSFSQALKDCFFDWILHLIFHSKKSRTLSSMKFKLRNVVKHSTAKLAKAIQRDRGSLEVNEIDSNQP
jgi:hypothetical protein